MPLLFRMRNTVFSFTLTLILQVRILDIPKLSRKAYLISQKILRNAERLDKKLTCELFDYLNVRGLLFTTENIKVR